MITIRLEPDITPVNGAVLTELIDVFLDDLSVAEVGEETLSGYTHHLALFRSWWSSHGKRWSWTLTPDRLRQFGVWLRRQESARGRPYAASSRNTTVRRVRQFLAWLHTSGRMPVNIADWLPLPPKTPQPARGLRPADLCRLFEAALGGYKPARDVALLAFLAGTGCRRMELIHAQVQNLELHADGAGSCYLEITKNGKPRTVLFGPQTGQALRSHLAGRWGDGPIFHDLKYPDAVTKAVRRLSDRAGLDATPHRLRKLFSSYWYARYPDDQRAAFLCKLQMGHAPANVTEQHYLLMSHEDVRPFYVSPLEDPAVAPFFIQL